jgi:hypothetical protein
MIPIIGEQPVIIGQPKLTDWAFSIVIHCTCKKTVLWMGKPAGPNGPGAIAGCSCGKLYTLLAMPVRDPETGNLDIKLAMKEMPK